MIDPASSKDVLGTLGIDGWHFLAQLVNFSIVLIVMWKWVYTPLLKLMDKRAKEIADGLDYAKRAEQRLHEAEFEKEQVIQAAKMESHTILEETRAKADAVRQEKMALAKKEIEIAVDEAKERIKGEKQAAFDALKQEIANLVALTTEKVASNLSAEDQQKLIANAMKDLEKT